MINLPSQRYIHRTLKDVKADAAKQAIRQALVHANGNVGKAAFNLGVARQFLSRLIKRYDLGIFKRKRGEV